MAATGGEGGNAARITAAFQALENGDLLAMRRLYDDDVELWVPTTSGTP
jgi:ketosteroid isomerase-like protein